MFDCGISFKAMKDDLYKVRYLFLTHRHSDHINITTLNKIRKKYPRIKVIGNYDLTSLTKLDYMVGDETRIELDDRVIQAFKCVHDVVCSGYVVSKDDINFIYATDTSSLEFAPKIKYDYMFIESNYDKKKIEQVRNQTSKYGYNPWQAAMRHLSTQESQLFYFLNRRDKESKRIQLHKSRRFY